MQKLSKKKLVQAERFFDDPKKCQRLNSALKRKSLKEMSVTLGYDHRWQPVVFRARIGGKDRAVKFSEDQRLARSVLYKIKKQHDLAVKSGEFNPKHYVLKIIPFLAAGSKGGAMPIVKAVDLSRLMRAIYSKNLDENVKGKNFLEKHPWVTYEKLCESDSELSINLAKLFHSKRISNYDITKSSNIFVLGADDKKKKLIFGLIDPIHPNLR